MKLPGSLGELTYCTNIHPGESWEEVRQNLERHTTRVKERVSPVAPMGVGLRLSAEAARSLREPRALADFRAFLDEQSLYVFTLNGFPYGRFHGEPVKARVYEPDWSTRARLDYTRDLAEILHELLPEGASGSISTVPCCFRPKSADPGLIDACVQHLLELAAHIHTRSRSSGKQLTLALEPEPHCLLETTREAVTFIEERLLGAAALTRFSEMTGLGTGDSELALRRHVGLCLDACHAAVEFETPEESVALAAQAGVKIAKVQLSAGLRLPSASRSARAVLRRFDDAVYLHQVVVRKAGELVRFLDAPDALDGTAVDVSEEWRVHFHVPLFADSFGELKSTQDYVAALLAIQCRTPFTEHLEVETYTWEVLPEAHRPQPVDAAIAEELEWVLSQIRR